MELAATAGEVLWVPKKAHRYFEWLSFGQVTSPTEMGGLFEEHP